MRTFPKNDIVQCIRLLILNGYRVRFENQSVRLTNLKEPNGENQNPISHRVPELRVVKSEIYFLSMGVDR